MSSISEGPSSNISVPASNSDPSLSTTTPVILNQQESHDFVQQEEDLFGNRQKDEELDASDLLFGSESFEVLRTQSYGYGSDNGSG